MVKRKFRSVNDMVIAPANTESDNKNRNVVTRMDKTKIGKSMHSCSKSAHVEDRKYT